MLGNLKKMVEEYQNILEEVRIKTMSLDKELGLVYQSGGCVLEKSQMDVEELDPKKVLELMRVGK